MTTDARIAAILEAAATEPQYPNGGVVRGPFRCMASDRWSMLDANGRQYCAYYTCQKPEGHDGPHRFESPAR